VALAVVQVASVAPLASYLPVRDARWLYPTPPAIAWLQQHVGSARVLIADQVGLLYGLRQAHGYDGLTPRRVADLAGPIGTGGAAAAGYRENTVALHGSEPLPPLAVLLNPAREVLGVRFIVLPPAVVPEPRLRLVYEGPDARVFEDPAALPRAFVAARATCVDDRSAVARLRSRSLAPLEEVLLADCGTPPEAAPRAAAAAEARITVDDPARVVISASAAAPAWLVLTDTWFPGWRARLDGVEVALLRADHAFRAVALPAGTHEIELSFAPRGLRAGVAISLGALLVVVVMLLHRRARAAAIAATAAFVLLAAGRADAALPAPPFELALTPGTVTAGETVGLEIVPRAAAGGPWDVYILWLHSERAAFLGRDGAWSPRPVPFRAGLAAGERVRATWPRAGPPADVTLALVAIRPGADPLERLDWMFRPALAHVRVIAPPGDAAPRPWTVLAALGVAAVVITALAWGGHLPRPRSL
jgi:hypothetical protein